MIILLSNGNFILLKSPIEGGIYFKEYHNNKFNITVASSNLIKTNSGDFDLLLYSCESKKFYLFDSIILQFRNLEISLEHDTNSEFLAKLRPDTSIDYHEIDFKLSFENTLNPDLNIFIAFEKNPDILLTATLSNRLVLYSLESKNN